MYLQIAGGSDTAKEHCCIVQFSFPRVTILAEYPQYKQRLSSGSKCTLLGGELETFPNRCIA